MRVVKSLTAIEGDRHPIRRSRLQICSDLGRSVSSVEFQYIV